MDEDKQVKVIYSMKNRYGFIIRIIILLKYRKIAWISLNYAKDIALSHRK